MEKYKVHVIAFMEFEIEAQDDWSANNEATNYVENNKHEFDWNFDSIKNIKTGKEV